MALELERFAGRFVRIEKWSELMGANWDQGVDGREPASFVATKFFGQVCRVNACELDC